eukprot:m.307973 g.307973  ORF g.307973 m.307973 type:complete len:1203 (-) comp16468_c0_seq5:32-3640(-)
MLLLCFNICFGNNIIDYEPKYRSANSTTSAIKIMEIVVLLLVSLSQYKCGDWFYEDERGMYINLPDGDLSTGIIATTNESCTISRNKIQITSLSLDLNATNITINTSDARFHSGGSHDTLCPASWGMAVNCQFNERVRVFVNLTETPFSVESNAAFKHEGNGLGVVNCTDSGQICAGDCDGTCGGCVMQNNELVIVDSEEYECGVRKHLSAYNPKNSWYTISEIFHYGNSTASGNGTCNLNEIQYGKVDHIQIRQSPFHVTGDQNTSDCSIPNLLPRGVLHDATDTLFDVDPSLYKARDHVLYTDSGYMNLFWPNNSSTYPNLYRTVWRNDNCNNNNFASFDHVDAYTVPYCRVTHYLRDFQHDTITSVNSTHFVFLRYRIRDNTNYECSAFNGTGWPRWTHTYELGKCNEIENGYSERWEYRNSSTPTVLDGHGATFKGLSNAPIDAKGYLTVSVLWHEGGSDNATCNATSQSPDHVEVRLRQNLDQCNMNGTDCHTIGDSLKRFAFNPQGSFKARNLTYYMDGRVYDKLETGDKCVDGEKKDSLINGSTPSLFRFVFGNSNCDENLDNLDHFSAYELPFCRTTLTHISVYHHNVIQSCNSTHVVLETFDANNIMCSDTSNFKSMPNYKTALYEMGRCYQGASWLEKWVCPDDMHGHDILTSSAEFLNFYRPFTRTTSTSTTTTSPTTTSTTTSSPTITSSTISSPTTTLSTTTTLTLSTVSNTTLTSSRTTSQTSLTSSIISKRPATSTVTSLSSTITTNTIPQRAAVKKSSKWVLIAAILGGVGVISVVIGALTATRKAQNDSGSELELPDLGTDTPEPIEVHGKWLCSKVGCGKICESRSQCIMHIRVHTGETPFKCNTCGKSFKQKSSLTRHLKTHTKEKPFKCDICGKGFAQKYNIVAHKKTHTKGQAGQHRSSGWLRKVLSGNKGKYSTQKSELSEQSFTLLNENESHDSLDVDIPLVSFPPPISVPLGKNGTSLEGSMMQAQPQRRFQDSMVLNEQQHHAVNKAAYQAVQLLKNMNGPTQADLGQNPAQLNLEHMKESLSSPPETGASNAVYRSPVPNGHSSPIEQPVVSPGYHSQLNAQQCENYSSPFQQTTLHSSPQSGLETYDYSSSPVYSTSASRYNTREFSPHLSEESGSELFSPDLGGISPSLDEIDPLNLEGELAVDVQEDLSLPYLDDVDKDILYKDLFEQATSSV